MIGVAFAPYTNFVTPGIAAPENSRPHGIAESFFERRKHGELAETYLY